MWSGVGKSGSPAPKPMTGSPAALSALALASTASVADSAMAATRRDAAAAMHSRVAPVRPASEPWTSRRRSVGRSARDASGHADDARPSPDIVASPPTCCPATAASAAGPSKVRPEAVDALAAGSPRLPRHQPPPGHRAVHGRAGSRNGLAELFALPDGYEVLLGNGGTTVVLGRRHLRPDRAAQPAPDLRRVLVQVRRGAPAAPHLDDPSMLESDARHPPRAPSPRTDVDLYALTHNETSTGVAMTLRAGPTAPTTARSWSSTPPRPPAGCASIPTEIDVYYFAPQKCLAVRRRPVAGGVSPAAIERIERIAASRPLDARVARPRHRPRELAQGPDLQHARPGHGLPRRPAGRVDQRATAGSSGRPRAAIARPRRSTRWAEASSVRHPVRRPTRASAATWSPRSTSTTHRRQRRVSGVLRRNGIVDTESYRKLGRNQLRVGLSRPSSPTTSPPSTRCIDHVVAALA